MVGRKTQTERPGGTLKKRFLVGLSGISFLVFVLGSFVVLYLFLDSVTSRLASAGGMPLPLPSVGGVTLVPNIEGVPTPTEATGSGEVGVPGKRRVNFLLLGIDQRDDEKGVPTRSDTIIVVSLDRVNKTAAMISFARDLWMEIPGYGENRINVPNFLGDAYKYPGGGPALAVKTLEQNFGLDIDYYARIDFRGFEKIVDTLGGVDIDVENAIDDWEYPTEDYETMHIYIPAGRQHMNGKVALQYARSRHTESDFGRARRQQKLLLAIRDRALALDVIPKLPTLVGTLWNMVLTDVPSSEFLRLAALLKDVDAKNVASLVVDTKLAQPYVGEGGADLLLPDKPAIRKAIGALLVDPAVKSEGAKIEVINGTSKTGLATKTGEYLTTHGFDVAKVSSADRSDYKQTQIVVTGDKKGTTDALVSALGLSPRSVVPGAPVPSGTPDIRILLGQDFTPLP